MKIPTSWQLFGYRVFYEYCPKCDMPIEGVIEKGITRHFKRCPICGERLRKRLPKKINLPSFPKLSRYRRAANLA